MPRRRAAVAVRLRLSTMMDVHIQQVEDGLGGIDAWDDILPGWGNSGATRHPEAAANATPAETAETLS